MVLTPSLGPAYASTISSPSSFLSFRYGRQNYRASTSHEAGENGKLSSPGKIKLVLTSNPSDMQQDDALSFQTARQALGAEQMPQGKDTSKPSTGKASKSPTGKTSKRRTGNRL